MIAIVPSGKVYHILRCVSDDPLRCGLTYCGRVFDERRQDVRIYPSMSMDAQRPPCEKCLCEKARLDKIWRIIEKEQEKESSTGWLK